MPAEYQLTSATEPCAVIRQMDQACIPPDMANRDYNGDQQSPGYLQWLEDGGVPDPYVEPVLPEPQPDALTEALRANARLDKGIQAAVDAAEEPPPAPSHGDIVDPSKTYVTWDEFSVLEAQVYTLQASVEAMLEGQVGTQPK